MNAYNKLVARICASLDFIGGFALTAMFALIALNVILRAIGHPIVSTHEWIQFLMVSAVGLTIANCALHNGHVSIGMFVDKLPSRCRTALAIVINIFILGFTLLSSWRMLQHGLGFIASRQVGMVSRVPFYPFSFVVSLGFFIYALVVVNNILQVVGAGGKKE